MEGLVENRKETTVIGAGMVGVMAALHLQDEGFEVSLIDRRPPGSECSYGNAGVLGSATCIPISMPGTLASVPGWILDSEGPLTINWKYVPKLVPWLYRFIRSGNRERVFEIARALDALHHPTIDIYRQYSSQASAAHLIKENGYLHVFESQASFDSSALAREIRTERNIAFTELSPGDIKDLEPRLDSGLAKGLLIHRDGHTINPGKLVALLAQLFQQRGGTIVCADVTSIRHENGRPTALSTSQGTREFQNLVICAGAWSAELLAQLGEKVPLEAERGYHVELKNSAVELSRPVFFVDRKFLASSMEGGLRLAGTAEYDSLYAPPNYQRARVLLSHAGQFFGDLETDNYSEWMGSRPSTPDSVPVICQSRTHQSVFYAFGHGHTGMAGAPMTGKLISELVAGKPPSIDPLPYSLYRF